MIKYFYVILLIFLTGCTPWSHVIFYNKSSQNNDIKIRKYYGYLWEKKYHIKPNFENGTAYLFPHHYVLEISLDSRQKAWCIMHMKTPCTFYIYDNGFLFSIYDESVSVDLVKKYKVNVVNGKNNLVFHDLYKDQIYFYPFNTSSPFSPIYLYDKNPPLIPLLRK